MVKLSHRYMATGKTIALTRQIFVSKVMSLFLNMLCRFVIAFLPRSKHLLISRLQSLSPVIMEPQKRKFTTASTFSPSIRHEVMGLDAMILVFWMLIKRLFSFSLFSSIRVVSSAYLRFLIFLPAILISASDSSSLAYHMMYSAQILNKQDDSIQPWRTPFPILKQSVVPCSVLTIASWSVYSFLRR